jgi:hypothetical protein
VWTYAATIIATSRGGGGRRPPLPPHPPSILMTAGKAERHRAPETGIKDRVSMATTRIDMVVRERGTLTLMRSHHRGQRWVTLHCAGSRTHAGRGVYRAWPGHHVTAKVTGLRHGRSSHGGSLQAICVSYYGLPPNFSPKLSNRLTLYTTLPPD